MRAARSKGEPMSCDSLRDFFVAAFPIFALVAMVPFVVVGWLLVLDELRSRFRKGSNK